MKDGAPFGIAGITAQGIGAALSTTVAGFVVVSAGYSADFLTLAGVAAAGLLLFWFAMPEPRTPMLPAPIVPAS
jgi:sugar phosphate permease